ncbi:MAG: alpha/beta fold hydrolase [Polyangiaceae bacterium]
MPFVERTRGKAPYRIHYEVRGAKDAPPLVLVMGLGFSSGAWGSLPDRLSARFRVVTVDNRGTGRSTAPRGPFRTRDLADDVASVLDDLGVAKAHVFGISMGGMIASELVLRHPTKVDRLLLAATFAGYLRSTKPSFGAMVDLLACAFSPSGAALARIARLLVSDAYYADHPEAFAAWIRGTGSAPARTAARQMLAVGLHDTTRRLANVRAPTVVLTGDADRLVPAKNSHVLAKLIPGARLVLLPGAGHCFAVEREDATVDVVVSHFLDS